VPVETIVIWLIVGAVAGYLAGLVVKGGVSGFLATLSSALSERSLVAGCCRGWGFISASESSVS